MRPGVLAAIVFTYILANEKTRKMFDSAIEEFYKFLEKETKNKEKKL